MIVNNIEILSIVEDLDNKYNASPMPDLQWVELYSKLAIIEFCGWIEETFDEILIEYIDNKLTVEDNRNYIKKTIIKRNNGFHYDNNFRKMMMNIIGMKNLENFENYLESKGALLVQLKPILEKFTTLRNKAAHTYTPKGITSQYDSPSVVISNINQITPILQKIEQKIMNY